MSMRTNSLRVAVIAALAALSLAACDRTDGRTVGQKLDSAVDKTQQKLDAAGEKIAAATDNVKADVKAGADDARTSDAGRAMSDTAITASIKTDLVKDPDLSALKIEVDTKDGVVTLNGLTDNDAARQRAEKMASAVKGVKEVRNFLVVKHA